MHLVTKIAIITAVYSMALTNVSANNVKIAGETQVNTEKKEGFLQNVFNLKSTAAVGLCTLTSINGTTLTCTKDGATYTVETSNDTHIRRKFWGKGNLSEMKVGDQLNVIGKWSNEARTEITAKLVRDTSIQMRQGVFFGKVLSIVSDGWIISTDKRGDQKVTISSSTKLVNRKEESIDKTDILVGHRIRVKGLWDKTQNVISDVVQVKDFSIPEQEEKIKSTITVTITPTP